MQQITLANDLGYGSVKALINSDSIKMPSVMAIQRAQDLFDPIVFSTQASQDTYISDLLTHLDVSVQSPVVKTSNRVLIGTAAINSHLPLTTFDVNDLAGKADTDLSMILTLALIAGQAVKDNYRDRKGKLDSQIDADVKMATALPILEGKRDKATDNYRDRYMKQNHVVTLHNFREVITVHIHFSDVVVALEGETAQYQLMNANDALTKAIKKDFDKHYPQLAGDVSAKDLVGAGDTLGIDIGEGTTDLAVFNDHAVNIHASSSMPMGYGNALEEAIADLQAKQFNIRDRASLQTFINRPVNPLAKSKQTMAKSAINDQLARLGDAIVDSVSQALRKASAGVDVIYVYGGGATPMEPYLRQRLMSKTKAFNGNIDIPVVWINATYAQYMNEAGLHLILNRLLQA